MNALADIMTVTIQRQHFATTPTDHTAVIAAMVTAEKTESIAKVRLKFCTKRSAHVLE